ncbi:MAG: hypothetical protein QOH47_1045 [Sphingomonadales bacterium]|jgi:hypothetical protein|nr:hypothetical protein [Sphingomonadales bacterium]
MRAVAGIICGLVAGLVVTILVGIIGVGATFTVPAGMDPANTRQILEAFAGMPPGSQVALAIAWLAGALVGALVAKMIARKAWAAWVVTILMTLYFGLSSLTLPLPIWAKALWIVAPLLGGFIGDRLVRAAPPAATADPAAEI